MLKAKRRFEASPFEKAVRRKPQARRTRDLCKLNGAKRRSGSWQEWLRPVKEQLGPCAKTSRRRK
jgi:hypothetical protein